MNAHQFTRRVSAVIVDGRQTLPVCREWLVNYTPLWREASILVILEPYTLKVHYRTLTAVSATGRKIEVAIDSEEDAKQVLFALSDRLARLPYNPNI